MYLNSKYSSVHVIHVKMIRSLSIVMQNNYDKIFRSNSTCRVSMIFFFVYNSGSAKSLWSVKIFLPLRLLSYVHREERHHSIYDNYKQLF